MINQSSVEKSLKRVKLNDSNVEHLVSTYTSSPSTPSTVNNNKTNQLHTHSNSSKADKQTEMDMAYYTSSNEGNSLTSNDNQACSNNSFQDSITDSSNTSSSGSKPKSKSSSTGNIVANNFFHVLSPMGTILCCSLSCLELTGYRSSELIGQLITKFIYYEDLEMFKRFFFNPSDQEYSICYRFQKKQEGYTMFEASRVSYLIEDNKIGSTNVDNNNDRITKDVHVSKEFNNYPKEKCFFFMAQPYFSELDLTRNVLERLKAEKKNLQKKLQWYEKLDKKLGYSPKVDSSISDTLCNSSNSSSEANFNRCQSEESSKVSENQKKKNLSKEHLPCTQCGTKEAPEWRKGPMGPKTLCNACGIRFFRDKGKQNSPSEISRTDESNQPMRFISIQPKPQS